MDRRGQARLSFSERNWGLIGWIAARVVSRRLGSVKSPLSRQGASRSGNTGNDSGCMESAYEE